MRGPPTPTLQDAYRRLEEREALLQSILDTVPDAMVVIDERGIIQSTSRTAEAMFGYGGDELVGRNVSLLMPSPHRERHNSYIARYLRTGERRIIGIGRVVTGQRKDGSTFPIELAVSELDVHGRRLFTGFIRDLTERQRTEKRLQELQDELTRVARVSELGQMSAALSHELNQPLTAIANYIEACRALLARKPVEPNILDMLDKAGDQALRAGQIIRRLRQLLEKRQTEYRAESINKVVEEASALALVGAKEAAVRVRLELEAENPVIIDKVQIQQVVLNLVRNAIEAMAGADRRLLTIQTTEIADMVRVSVHDTGPGLSEEIRAQLFQPFVTSKKTGLGIGLWICRTIIEAHGGEITSEPDPAGGLTFAFTVPVADPES